MLSKITKFFNLLDINLLAKETSFVKRSTARIRPSDFLISFLCSYSTDTFSLRNWARELYQFCGVKVSHQAIDKKFSCRHLSFLKTVLTKSISKILEQENKMFNDTFKSFNRVLIGDSTCVKLSDSQYGTFSGCSNQTSKKAITRIQVLFDLKVFSPLIYQMCTYSENDVKYADEILSIIQKDDLTIRDLGYWKKATLEAIHQKGAYFISRLKSNARLLDINDNTLNFIELLKKMDKKK